MDSIEVRPNKEAEYFLTNETSLELKHEKPFYGADGKIGLVMYANDMMHDYMATRYEGFKGSFADAYMEAFLELDRGGKEVSPVLYLMSDDEKGRHYEAELRLSDESRKNGFAMVAGQVSHIGFKDMDALQKDYRQWHQNTFHVPYDKPKTACSLKVKTGNRTVLQEHTL